jgi:hypothetical protein
MPNAIKYSTTGDTLSLKKGNIFFGVGDVGKGPSSATTYYNGVTPTSGGYTIYSYNAAQTSKLSFHTAVSDLALITYTNGVSGQNFTTATQCLNWYATQTNYVCVNRDYEGIVTNGLVLNLDAGFTPSYSTSGTTWYDLAYSGNNGTLTNGPTFSGSNGGSIVFDSADDYVTVPYNSSLDLINTVSLETWVKYTTTTNTVLIEKSDNNSHYQLQIFNSTQGTPGIAGQLVFMLQPNSDNWVVSGVVTNDNNWHHVVGTYERSTTTAKIYVDGVLKNTNPSISTGPTTNTQPLLIGSRSGVAGFGGSISGVKIYGRVLSSTEILQNYNAGLSRFNTLNIVKSGLQLNLDSSNEVSYPSSGTLWGDLSGNGNSSNGIGSPTFDATTKSFQFDATDDRFYSSISKPFDMYCLEITFKPHKQISSNVAADNNAYSLLGVRRTIGNNNGINVYEWTGGMTDETVSIWSHDGFATGIVNTVTNEFHTMTFNWNGSTYDIWLDGQKKSTIQRTNGHAQLLTNVTDVDPGYNAGYNYYHKGNISVVRAYDRSLSDGEILQNYYQAPIVTEGLVMVLDAGNLVSYSGAGTTWKDLTTNGYNGTLTNGPTFSSLNGGYIVFDGSDDWVQIPTYTFGNGNWSVNIWVNTDSLSNYNLISNSSGGPVTNAFGFESNKIFYRNYDGNWQNNLGNTTLSTNTWYMLTWVNYAGASDSLGTMQMFVNGISDSSTFNSYTINGGPCNAIGRNWFSYFSGEIGNVQFYNKSLTSSEVAQNYNAYKSRFGL